MKAIGEIHKWKDKENTSGLMGDVTKATTKII